MAPEAFKPLTRSTITTQAHRVDQSMLSWLYIHIVFRCYLLIRVLIDQPETPGLRQYNRLIDPIRLRKKWDVQVSVYPLWHQLRSDTSLGLQDMDVKQIWPARPLKPQRTVVYWNGGGYVSGPTKRHVAMMCRLAVDLNARVIAVPYELAPFSILASNFVRFVALCVQVAHEARDASHELIFAGDSAGAGIAAGMIRALANLGPLHSPDTSGFKVLPDQLFLITPWLDGSLSQSDTSRFKKVQARDYWLRELSLRDWARQWVGGGEARRNALKALPSSFAPFLPAAGEITHPYISPLLDDEHYRLLASHNISVSLSLATRDTLCLDSFLYLRRLEEAGVRAHCVQGVGGMHLYPLLQNSGMSESSAAMSWMIAAVQRFSHGDLT